MELTISKAVEEINARAARTEKMTKKESAEFITKLKSGINRHINILGLQINKLERELEDAREAASGFSATKRLLYNVTENDALNLEDEIAIKKLQLEEIVEAVSKDLQEQYLIAVQSQDVSAIITIIQADAQNDATETTPEIQKLEETLIDVNNKLRDNKEVIVSTPDQIKKVKQ